MGQRPRRLDPSKSMLNFFGAELRRHREEAGLSQAELAVLVRFSADAVRRVETAERQPTDRFVHSCDTALGTRGALIAVWASSSCFTNRQKVATGGVFNARALDRPVLDWLVGEHGQPEPDPDRASGEPSFEQTSAELARLRTIDHRFGAGAIVDELTTLMSRDVTRLRSHPSGVATSSKAEQAIVIGAYELAGYAAVDVGRAGEAQRYYLDGLQASQLDRSYGGYLIGVSLAHLALHCNDPTTALRMTHAARSGISGTRSPALHAALSAVTARAYARLGDHQACARAMTRADHELASSRSSAEPDWITYFDETYLADERAHCYVDLGLHGQAQAELHTILATTNPIRGRRLAIDTALLATSLAACGQIEQACEIGRGAVDHAANTSSTRSRQRVWQILAQLAHYPRTDTVREFHDYLHSRLSESGASCDDQPSTRP